MSKTFLGIGAGPGIGLATAQRFAREGFRIRLAARNLGRLHETANLLQAMGASVEVHQIDARDASAVASLVSQVGDGLQVLHYNAGVLHYGEDGALLTKTLEDESTESLVSDLQINVSSALSAIKAALPAFTAQRTGTVLLTGGGLGVQPSANFLTLSVGKAGIRAVAQALFEPLKQRGIHVGTVTVARLVSPQSIEAAEIAEAFWTLYAQPQEGWTNEITYS